MVSFHFFFHPQFFFLVSTLMLHHTWRLLVTFFFFFETLIEERASGLQAIHQVFQSLNFNWPCKTNTGTWCYNAVGWRSLQKCLHMDSKQDLNFWSKSVWKGFIYSCLNNFSDTLLHTILCPVPYISLITVHLLWCVHQFISFPLVLHGAHLFDFQVFLRKPVVNCT